MQMQETAACEVEAKKDGCGFCKVFLFFFSLTCMARVDLQKDSEINMPECLVMCEYVAVDSSRSCYMESIGRRSCHVVMSQR